LKSDPGCPQQAGGQFSGSLGSVCPLEHLISAKDFSIFSGFNDSSISDLF